MNSTWTKRRRFLKCQRLGCGIDLFGFVFDSVFDFVVKIGRVSLIKVVFVYLAARR